MIVSISLTKAKIGKKIGSDITYNVPFDAEVWLHWVLPAKCWTSAKSNSIRISNFNKAALHPKAWPQMRAALKI